jgi:hypothetical protein
VEAGNDDAVLTILTDIDGQDRVYNFHVDIGADESDGTFWPSSGIRIGTAITYTEGTEVVLIGLSVAASFYSDQGFIYGEEQDRANGIRIFTFDPFVEGEIIDVIGTIQSDMSTGEAYILPYAGWPKHSGGFKPSVALGIDAHSLGGKTRVLQGGIPGMQGVNNIGLLVTTWGTVTSIDPSTYPAWFIITTPSGVEVKAMLPAGMALPVAINDIATVRGANSLELLAGNISRVIWVRKADDVVRRFP